MGIQLSDLRNDSRSIEVTVYLQGEATDTLSITYRPSKLTPDFDKSLELARENREWGVTFVTETVLSWDLMDGATSYPITKESVSVLPDYLVGGIVMGVLNDMGKARAVLSDS